MAGRFFSSSWKRWLQPGLAQCQWKWVIGCEIYFEVSAIGLGILLSGDTEQVKKVSKMMFWFLTWEHGLGSCCLFETENVRGQTEYNHYIRPLPFPSFLPLPFPSCLFLLSSPLHPSLHFSHFIPVSSLFPPPLWRPWIFNLKFLIPWSHCLLWSPKLFWQRKVTLTSVLRTNLWVKITTAYHLAKLCQISLNA